MRCTSQMDNFFPKKKRKIKIIKSQYFSLSLSLFFVMSFIIVRNVLRRFYLFRNGRLIKRLRSFVSVCLFLVAFILISFISYFFLLFNSLFLSCLLRNERFSCCCCWLLLLLVWLYALFIEIKSLAQTPNGNFLSRAPSLPTNVTMSYRFIHKGAIFF